MTGTLTDAEVDLGRVFGLTKEAKGYFAMPHSATLAESVRAVMVGIEVKDMFIEANRAQPKPTRTYRHAGTDYDDARSGRLDTGRREATIEIARPRAWRRP